MIPGDSLLLIPAVAAAVVVLHPVPGTARTARLFGALILAAVLLHGMLVGFRWQLVPASVLMGGVGLFLLAKSGQPFSALTSLSIPATDIIPCRSVESRHSNTAPPELSPRGELRALCTENQYSVSGKSEQVVAHIHIGPLLE